MVEKKGKPGCQDANPLLAREQFAISLRKNKKKEVLVPKRKKVLDYLLMKCENKVLPNFMQNADQISSVVKQLDSGADSEMIEKIVQGLCLISYQTETSDLYQALVKCTPIC